MPYTDFTLEEAEARFDLVTVRDDLFPALEPLPVPTWLSSFIVGGLSCIAMHSEKARSEVMVAPVLLACRDLIKGEFRILSGQRLDVDAERGLDGERDFLLALTPPVPRLRDPLVAVVVANRGEFEFGLGKCVAQMVGTRLFNEQAGRPTPVVYGVVTTGAMWQFLRLAGPSVTLHHKRLFSSLGGVLAALQAILGGKA